MCIPHGATPNLNSGGRIKREKTVQKSLKRVSKHMFEKGDPNFKDERHPHEAEGQESKKSWLSSLFSHKSA